MYCVSEAFLATLGVVLTISVRILIARIVPRWSWKSSVLILIASLTSLVAVITESHSRSPDDPGSLPIQFLRFGAILFGIFASQFALAWWPPIRHFLKP